MKHVISYYGSVTTGAINTFVSKKLNFPYRIEKIRVKFALGHAATVLHRFFVSGDDIAVTSGTPTGVNVLKQYGNVDYVVGDDDVLELDDETYVYERATYIKVHVYNSDTVTHTINVIITIDDLRDNPVLSAIKMLLKIGSLTPVIDPETGAVL